MADIDTIITTDEPTEPADAGSVVSETGAAVPTDAVGIADATKQGDEAPTAASVATVVPEMYDLKLPPDSGFDPAIVERTAATARELGLSNEAGQKLLDSVVSETQKHLEAIDAAWVEANKPGGTEWKKRDQAWRAEVLADPEIGGTPEQAKAVAEKANLAVMKFFSPEGKKLIKESGLGSHPEFVRAMAKIGKSMSETPIVMGNPAANGRPRSTAEVLYGEDGMGPPRTPTN